MFDDSTVFVMTTNLNDSESSGSSDADSGGEWERGSDT